VRTGLPVSLLSRAPLRSVGRLLLLLAVALTVGALTAVSLAPPRTAVILATVRVAAAARVSSACAWS
jgi:hypothetical protein